MLINEISRLSQLTPAGLDKLANGMAEHGILFRKLEIEISSRIKSLSDTDVSDGMEWYRQANGFALELAGTYNTTPEIASAILSALSPRMPWLRNKTVARYVLQNLASVDGMDPIEAAKTFGKGLYSNFAMAVKIARGEDIANTLTGTKRRSFYNNIVSPDNGDSVTIDTWMVRALMNTVPTLNLDAATKLLKKNETALGGTGMGYYALAESCRTVAEKMSITPCQVQALYWIAVSGSANGGRADITE